MKMVILNGDLMAAFRRISSGKLSLNSWSIFRKITTMESNLNKVVPATSFSGTGNFLDVFQEFSFRYKKHLLGVAYGGGVTSFFL